MVVVVASVMVVLSSGLSARCLAGMLPAVPASVGLPWMGGARALRGPIACLLRLGADHAVGGLGGGDARGDVEPPALAAVAVDGQVQLVVGQVHPPQLLGGVVGPPDQHGLVAQPEHPGPGLGQRARRDHRGRASVGRQRRGDVPGLGRAEHHDVAVGRDDVILIGAAAVVRVAVAQPRDHLVRPLSGLAARLLVAPLTTDRRGSVIHDEYFAAYSSTSLTQYRTPARTVSNLSPLEMRFRSSARNASWFATWRGHDESSSWPSSSQSWSGGSAHE